MCVMDNNSHVCYTGKHFKGIVLSYLRKRLEGKRRRCVSPGCMPLWLAEIRREASERGVLLAEGEGEGVCRRSDGVLCLHVGHVLCVGVADGNDPVSHPDAGLSRLSPWGQLERENTEGRGEGGGGRKSDGCWRKTTERFSLIGRKQ